MPWLCAVLSTALLAVCASGQQQKTSQQMYPTPWGNGGPDGWDEAYVKARDFVKQLTLTEKVNLTTGTGWNADRCVGMTGGVPRLNFSGLCLEDGPLGVRYGELPPARTYTVTEKDARGARGVEKRTGAPCPSSY
jgi:beta-glucosidase